MTPPSDPDRVETLPAEETRDAILGDGPVEWVSVSEWVIEAQQERSRITMRKVLDAALALFERKGYEATTVSEIARDAGIAPGSIYRRFSDKDAILFAITHSFYATRTGEFDRMLATRFAEARSGAEVLALYNRTIFSAYRKDAGLIRLMERRALVDPVLRTRVMAAVVYVAERIGACLATFEMPLPPGEVASRMITWHHIQHNTLAMTILADDGDPPSPLSVFSEALEADMLTLLTRWFEG